MTSLTQFVECHRRAVLVGWAVVFIASLAPFSLEANHLTNGGYEVPHSGSREVEQAAHLFPKLAPNGVGMLVVKRSGGPVTNADIAQARAVASAAARKVPGVTVASESLTFRAEHNTAAVVSFNTSQDQNKAVDATVKLRKAVPAGNSTARYYLIGQPALWAGYDAVSKSSLVSAEAVGFPVTLLVLIAVFGSVAAAMLPLALGFISVAVTGAITYWLASAMTMSIYVSNAASLIGIAVGVDYSLFILARYRQAIRAGAEPSEALRTAMRTSGRAVAFSGATVILALAGLFLINSVTLRSMALGAVIVVAVAVAGALSLTPAAILTFGERLRGPSPRLARLAGRLRRGSITATPGAFWERWAARVTRRPLLSFVAAVALLVVLALPAFSLHTVTQALPELPASSDARVGAQTAIAKFGPVASGSTYVVASYSANVDPAAQRELEASVRANPGVASAAPPVVSSDGRHVLVEVISRQALETQYTRNLINRLRRDMGAVAAHHHGVSIAVGGTAAHEVDFDTQIAGSLWKVVIAILVASVLIVFVLLRSLVLPLKAILMNVLTVAASFGVLVAVFQWGWFDGLFGFHSPGYVATLALPFVLAVMFGLSMDYEVFLLARTQEEYRSTGDTRRAVQTALQTSAGTITSAAVIMCVVFLVFVAVSLATVQMLGLGLAVAVALDATVVRLVLVPAAIVLMGRANWWIPAWLERLFARRAPAPPPLATSE